MTNILEKGLSVLLGFAALAIVGVEVHREFAPPPAAPGRPPSVHLAKWRAMLPAANVIGSAVAPVTIIVFTDFQCPFCRRFNAVLATVRAKFPNAIATALIHLPLPGHKYANAAASAAECASASGRFAEAVDFLYEKQDSIGTLPWSSFAIGAGVRDTIGFARCMADSSATRRVQIGKATAANEGFNATPTVIVNGWRYSVPPSDTELVRAIGDILAGKRPYKGFPLADVVSQ